MQYLENTDFGYLCMNNLSPWLSPKHEIPIIVKQFDTASLELYAGIDLRKPRKRKQTSIHLWFFGAKSIKTGLREFYLMFHKYLHGHVYCKARQPSKIQYAVLEAITRDSWLTEILGSILEHCERWNKHWKIGQQLYNQWIELSF